VGLLSQDDRVSAGAQGGARFSAAGLPSMVDRSRAADDDWITDAPPPSAMAAALLAEVDRSQARAATGDGTPWLDTLARIDQAPWQPLEPLFHAATEIDWSSADSDSTSQKSSDEGSEATWCMDPADSRSSSMSDFSSDTDNDGAGSDAEMLAAAYMAGEGGSYGQASGPSMPPSVKVQSPAWSGVEGPVPQARLAAAAAHHTQLPLPLGASSAAQPPPGPLFGPPPHPPPPHPPPPHPPPRQDDDVHGADEPRVCPVCERECTAQHRFGQFWKSFGYDGPAYCNRCSSVFRAHMLIGTVAEKRCSAQAPCHICKAVLAHFARPVEANKSTETMLKLENGDKKNILLQPLETKTAATSGVCSVCSKTSDTALGVFWKKFGYAGPPYCTLCSHAFRNHIIRQRKTRVKCSRKAPCPQCSCILSKCHHDPETVYRMIEQAQQSLKTSHMAKKRARQLSPVSHTAGTKIQRCTSLVPPALALFVTVVACVAIVAWMDGPPSQVDSEPVPSSGAAAVWCGWESARYFEETAGAAPPGVSMSDDGAMKRKLSDDDGSSATSQTVVEVHRHIDTASLDRCANSKPVAIGSSCDYTCDAGYVPFGDMTCQRNPVQQHTAAEEDYALIGGYCRLPMATINGWYAQVTGGHPGAPLAPLFNDAWTQEYQFAGNQSCGGRWTTGQCWCAARDSWEVAGAPDDSRAQEAFGFYDSLYSQFPTDVCSTVAECEALPPDMVGGDKHHIHACLPWRDPAVLRLLRGDLLQLNLGALLNIYMATGLDYDGIRDSQMLENICGTQMPPFDPLHPTRISTSAVPPQASTGANLLPLCPGSGMLRPNANLSEPVWQKLIPDPHFADETVEAVKLLGLKILIPRIVCAVGQQQMDDEGRFMRDARVVPLPPPLSEELGC
jgi:hypothetical protein